MARTNDWAGGVSRSMEPPAAKSPGSASSPSASPPSCPSPLWGPGHARPRYTSGPDVFGARGKDEWAARDDISSSTAGIFELETDGTSGSETDDSAPSTSSTSYFPPRASLGRAGPRAPVSHMPMPSHRARQRSSDGTTWSSMHSAPLGGSARSFRTTPSFSSPLALAPVVQEDGHAPRTPAVAPGSAASPPARGSGRAAAPPRTSAAPAAALSRPTSSGDSATSSAPMLAIPSHSLLMPRRRAHRRAHSSSAMAHDAALCRSPIGGPDGVDPGFVAAISAGPTTAPSTRRSISAVPMAQSSLSPPSDSGPWSESPVSSPGLRRETIRLQRMPRSVAYASDVLIPAPLARSDGGLRPTSPQPSPTHGSTSEMSRPTVLGLALALPGATPRPAQDLPDTSHRLARVIARSRAVKQKRWRRRAAAWDDAWNEGAPARSTTAIHACAHWDAVCQALQESEATGAPPARRADEVRVTTSLPCLSMLASCDDPAAADAALARGPTPRRRGGPAKSARVVSEKWTAAQTSRHGSPVSIDDTAAAQRQHMWGEVIQTKASCDAELDKVMAGLMAEADALVDQQPAPLDPDTTSVEWRWDDERAPLRLLERLATIAAELRFATLHTLLESPALCSSAIAGVQSLGALWDQHAEWPGRGWYVELLLTLAALSRVLEWWDAEHRFWSSDTGTAAPGVKAHHQRHAPPPMPPPQLGSASPQSSAPHPRSTSATGRGRCASLTDTPPASSSPLSPAGVPMRYASLREGPSASGSSVGASSAGSPRAPGHARTHSRTDSDSTLGSRSSNVLLELTPDLRIQFVSAAWQRIVGSDPGDLVDRSVSVILQRGGIELLERATRQLLQDDGHTVEVALDISMAATPSSERPLAMSAQGMLVRHHATQLPSHTMWVLAPREPNAPTSDAGFLPMPRGLPGDRSQVSTELVLCRICERDVPSWFFAKHSEICHETHKLEMELMACNETLLELQHTVVALRDALVAASEGAGVAPALAFRGTTLAPAAPADALRVVDNVLDALDRAMAISTPALPDENTRDAQLLLSPTSRDSMQSLQTWLGHPTRDAALAMLNADAAKLIKNKLHAVNRMSNTILYVETVRLESEAYVAQLLQDDEATGSPTPSVWVEAPEEHLAASAQALSLDDVSEDDTQPRRLLRSPIPIPTKGAPLLSTPPLSPHLAAVDAPLGRSLGRSPRLSATPHSPHVLPPTQSRGTEASIRDFELLKPISKGAYGSVFLTRKRATGDLYAIKMLRKTDMIAKNQVTNVRAERMILMDRAQSPFVVKLFFTFQSPEYLYLVMEYLPGGDCASLVKTFGALPDEWVVQYVAEIVQGLHYLHSTGVVHRDMKPDNLLIDHHGHLKLTDFGLSKFGLLGRHRAAPRSDRRWQTTWAQFGDKEQPVPLANVSEAGTPAAGGSPTQTETYFRTLSHPDAQTSGVIVGTPDYLAPESILGVGMDDFGVDWWAVGVILFEFLHGYPPFHASTPDEVFNRILSRKIAWDADVPIAADAYDLINRWLCMDRTQRLGASGVDAITSHPYFQDVDWAHLTDGDGPFVPQVSTVPSTDYFDARGVSAQTWQEDTTQPVHRPALLSKRSSGRSEPGNEFGSFSFKNLPVLKQANDEMLRRIRGESSPSAAASPSASSAGQAPWPGTVALRTPLPSPSASTKLERPASSMSLRLDMREERHVLLADANSVSRAVFQLTLGALNMHADIAQDGAELVQMAMGTTRYDAIFIRLGLCLIHAQDGARMIKSTRNPNSQTPIIALVAQGTSMDVSGSVFDGVLPLPAQPSTLATLLSSLQPPSAAQDDAYPEPPQTRPLP